MNKAFVDFAIHMGESSLELIDREKYHSGVYLGGYALEGYLKSILISKMGFDINKIKIHLNQNKKDFLLHKEVEKYLKLQMEQINDSLLISTNKNYPKNLIEGGENIDTENQWDVHKRYEVRQWSEKEYALKVQKEVENILSEIIDKYLTEGGRS